MPDLATRRSAAAPAPVGKLPSATTGMTIDDALEMTHVSRPEFALMAATTFKESRSLEELVSNIVFAQRRGLDPLSKQVYFEKFDGATPSLTTSIDGLRSIAYQTGKYAGSSDPVYRGTWEMPIEGGKKIVPAECLVTVWAMVGDRKCAFEATAHMDESYPGISGRGRMWRQWPKRMLATAAERLALRKAFPSVLGGIGDHEPEEAAAEEPPPRTSVTNGLSDAAKAQLYDEFFGQTGELPAPAPQLADETLRGRYYDRLKTADERGLVDPSEWKLRRGATTVEVEAKLQELVAILNADTLEHARGPAQSAAVTEPAESGPGGVASPPAPARSGLWSDNQELQRKAVELGILDLPTLSTRADDDAIREWNETARARIKVVEDELVGEARPQEALI